MKRLVIMAVCMLAAASAYAQDINGVSMGTVMSEDQIAKAFGKSYMVKPVDTPYAKSRNYMLFSKAFPDDYVGVTVDESDIIIDIWYHSSM